jgi:site-specific DNA recombinase
MGAARRKGKWVGGRPALGYDVVDGRLAVNADEAEQVRTLFRLYLQERSFRRVAGILNARGWRLKSWRNKEGKWVQGGEWDASAVHRHITNVVYIGRVDYEGAIYDGEHQPIIDAATFERAARIRADGRIDRGAEARNTTGYLLRGLIRCMVCNSIMTTATSGSHGRVYRYYSCTKATKRGKNACSVRSVPGPEIENVLVDQLAKRGWSPEIAGRVAHAVNEKRRAQAIALASEQRKLMSDLDRARVEGKNLLDLFTANEDIAQRKVVTERLTEIETRSAQMEARLAEIAEGWTTNEKLLVGAEQVEKILSSFMAVWSVFSTKERARMLHVLFDKIEFNGEKEVLEMFFTDAAKLALGEPSTAEAARGAA